MAEESKIVWRYVGDPGVGVDDEHNVMTLGDGRRIESREHLMAWLDEQPPVVHVDGDDR